MNTQLQVNPEWEFISVDVNQMAPGKFYIAYVNKDQATALIEAPPSNVPFTGIKYFKHRLTTPHSVEIWEVRKFGDQEMHINVTHKLDWYIEQPNNNLIILSREAIDGYIKFI